MGWAQVGWPQMGWAQMEWIQVELCTYGVGHIWGWAQMG